MFPCVCRVQSFSSFSRHLRDLECHGPTKTGESTKTFSRGGGGGGGKEGGKNLPSYYWAMTLKMATQSNSTNTHGEIGDCEESTI